MSGTGTHTATRAILQGHVKTETQGVCTPCGGEEGTPDPEQLCPKDREPGEKHFCCRQPACEEQEGPLPWLCPSQTPVLVTIFCVPQTQTPGSATLSFCLFLP